MLTEEIKRAGLDLVNKKFFQAASLLLDWNMNKKRVQK
jgi:hypothetical protein